MNIANKLTVFRMLLIPVFLVLMLGNFSWGAIKLATGSLPVSQLLAGLIFIGASFTDYLDGYLARKHNLVTAFGEFFDPMADKLLVIAALIVIVEKGWAPSWVVIIIVSRELLVTGLRVLLARANGKVMAAAMPGKIKTATQMLAIICYLFNDFGLRLFGYSPANILLYICLFFTIYSGIDYFYQGRFVFDGPK